MNSRFLLITLLIIGININGVYAARSSTIEEFQYALRQSVDSLRKTDNCFKNIQNSRDLMLHIKICSDEIEKIKDIRYYKVVGGKEASTCLAMAEVILLNRHNALSWIQTMVESMENKDSVGEQKATVEVHQCYQESLKWREKFKSTYGY